MSDPLAAFIRIDLSPTGVVFDPPAAISIPNSNGLPVGSVISMFAFDHDVGSFATMGTGTVTDDGMLIVSDPGSGIVKGG